MACRVVAVTGSPGAGKTALAGKLAGALAARYIDLKSYSREHRLVVGRDRKRGADVVDEEALRVRLGEELEGIEGDIVLDGLLSPFTQATHIIVLRCNPRVLLERLRGRGYSKEKIRENLEAEVQGVCLHDSMWCGNVLEVDATAGVKINEVLEWLARGGKKVEEIDWLGEFGGLLRRGLV